MSIINKNVKLVVVVAPSLSLLFTTTAHIEASTVVLSVVTSIEKVERTAVVIHYEQVIDRQQIHYRLAIFLVL